MPVELVAPRRPAVARDDGFSFPRGSWIAGWVFGLNSLVEGLLALSRPPGSVVGGVMVVGVGPDAATYHTGVLAAAAVDAALAVFLLLRSDLARKGAWLRVALTTPFVAWWAIQDPQLVPVLIISAFWVGCVLLVAGRPRSAAIVGALCLVAPKLLLVAVQLVG
jgi:hypothetical protein